MVYVVIVTSIFIVGRTKSDLFIVYFVLKLHLDLIFLHILYRKLILH